MTNVKKHIQYHQVRSSVFSFMFEIFSKRNRRSTYFSIHYFFVKLKKNNVTLVSDTFDSSWLFEIEALHEEYLEVWYRGYESIGNALFIGGSPFSSPLWHWRVRPFLMGTNDKRLMGMHAERYENPPPRYRRKLLTHDDP